ncbi:MAG TPA: ABC transporter ATP-binding protein [Acidimicrobiales bacterium]|nr:ABC transporter ATP-binding protein [Acidimicrobiales bacterium]
MEAAVRIEGLSKSYRIGARAAYGRLTETLWNGITNPIATVKGRRAGAPPFWALDDVSLEIGEGEVVGLIGRNGAGKSTLLKILSRITEPTKGRVEILGRVASLLEVGTGFHPELTGRENIFLNGAVMGMRRAEIKARFDEIVAFAGVEQFLETPVKRYSSGMSVRLAFAVAAHLEPDILVIDEVLSVGDAEFQKRSLGKIGELGSSGRTTIFVSHNMAAVETLCDRGVVLDHGRVQFLGSQTDAIGHYLASTQPEIGVAVEDRDDRGGSGEIRITSIEFRSTAGTTLPAVVAGQDLEIVLHYRTERLYTPATIVASIAVRDDLGVPVFLQHNRLTNDLWPSVPGTGAFVCRIEHLPLPPTTYRLDVAVINDTEFLDQVADAAEMTVVAGPFFGSSELPPRDRGLALVDATWRVEETN